MKRQAGNEYEQGLFVVLATRAGMTETWVAATTAKEAVTAVQLQTGPDWEVKVIDFPITITKARKLGLQPGDVRRLSK